MGQFKRMVIEEMDNRNVAMDEAIAAINALHAEDKVVKRWDKVCIAHSKEMNATPRGRAFIAKHGDPIAMIGNPTNTFRKWG